MKEIPGGKLTEYFSAEFHMRVVMEGLLRDVIELLISTYLCFVLQGTKRQEYFCRGRGLGVSLHAWAVKSIIDVDTIAGSAAVDSKKSLQH